MENFQINLASSLGSLRQQIINCKSGINTKSRKKMRITSPKSIPLKNSQSKMFNQQSKMSQKNNGNGINSRQAFHSHRNSIYGDSFAQYNSGKKESNGTDTYISNKSGRSRSNHHGISMSRDKTIKVDNIYEPEHFGLNKNSENYSTKSITVASNRNTKSISRLTRATSPTITSYPERSQSQYTLNEKRVSNGSLTKNLSQSYEQDTFDFKELKKQLIQADPYENDRILDHKKNQDYYGRPTQLTENRQFMPKNKLIKSFNQSNLSSDYNFSQKSLHRNSSKSKGLVPSMAQKEPSITSEHTQQSIRLEQSKDKLESSFFSSCTNSQSHKFIGSERQASTIKPYSPSSNSKLGWRDVIKK